MNKVLFITGNQRKIWQAQETLKQFNIAVESQELDVREIQSHDALEISRAKAQAAFRQTKKPLVICDHSWAFAALNGFPAGYMKDINHWFRSEDFLLLMLDKTDRTVVLTETIIYTDGQVTKEFLVKFRGRIIEEIRGTGHVPCERVVVYDGQDETIAERIDKGKHARDMSKSAWQEFGEWYAEL